MLRFSFFTFFTILLFFTITFCSCESYQRNNYISKFDYFIDKVEKRSSTYNEKDWQDADSEFKNLNDIEYEKFKNNLTNEQNSKINDLKGKYLAIRIKQGIKDYGKGLKNSIELINSAAKELSSDSTIK